MMDEAIVAHRSWDFQPEKGYLFSVFHNTIWPHKERLEAQTVGGFPALPAADTKYGIHAWRAERGWSVDTMPHLIPGFPVWGKVSLWGQVLMCDFGYRAQYAYPYSLLVREQDEWIAPLIRAAYLVDVEVHPS